MPAVILQHEADVLRRIGRAVRPLQALAQKHGHDGALVVDLVALGQVTLDAERIVDRSAEQGRTELPLQIVLPDVVGYGKGAQLAAVPADALDHVVHLGHFR